MNDRQIDIFCGCLRKVTQVEGQICWFKQTFLVFGTGKQNGVVINNGGDMSVPCVIERGRTLDIDREWPPNTFNSTDEPG